MSGDESSAKFFDAEEAFERVDNDKELFFELVDMFFEDYEDSLKGVQEAADNKEARHLEERSHSMKSALGNLGAMKGFYDAKFLEFAGKNENFEGVSERLESLKASIAKFKEEAETHR